MHLTDLLEFQFHQQGHESDLGVITIDGNDISKVSLNSFRSQLGVVLQDDFLG